MLTCILIIMETNTPQITLATLCDSAAEYNGKLCILGAFDVIHANTFPVSHHGCALAVRALFAPQDDGDHSILIQLTKVPSVDEVAATLPIFSFDKTLSVGFQPGMPFLTMNFILNLQRLRFDAPGVYLLSLSIDGTTATSIPLRLMMTDPA